MIFFIHQVAESLPESIKTVVDLINSEQTIWNIKWSDKIAKVDSYNPDINLAKIPSVAGSSFHIGVTSGRIDTKKLSHVDSIHQRAVVSEFIWDGQKGYDPPEVFWVMALTNICFQADINSECQNENCIGYKDYTVDNLLLKLINIEICEECEKKAFPKYKYQLPEIKNLIDSLRSPKNYKRYLDFNSPDLLVFKKQVRRLENDQVFKDYGILIIMHYLENIVSFIEALISLGASDESIFVLVKPYPYSHRSKVHSYLYRNHPKIRIEYLGKLPPADALLTDIISECKSKSASNEFIVIEDGGYLVPFLHKNYSQDDNACIGAVEQTTKGLRKDQNIQGKLGGKLFFPVIDVAKSKFKDAYESPLVGISVVHNIQKLLTDYNFSGKHALVIGCGAVGRQVAHTLRNWGMSVMVYDTEKEPIASAKVRGFDVLKSLTSPRVKNADLIIGTVGKTTINQDIFEHMKNGAILISASSDQIEIDINALDEICDTNQYTEGLGTKYKRDLGGGAFDTYTLLADGYPINFYFGSGIPANAIDPVLAQLLIGAFHLAKKHKDMKPIIQEEVMNDLVVQYKLLEDFLSILQK